MGLKWIKIFSNVFSDDKICDLIVDLGHRGFAVWVCLLTEMALKTDHSMMASTPRPDVTITKRALRVKSKVVQSTLGVVIEYLGSKFGLSYTETELTYSFNYPKFMEIQGFFIRSKRKVPQLDQKKNTAQIADSRRQKAEYMLSRDDSPSHPSTTNIYVEQTQKQKTNNKDIYQSQIDIVIDYLNNKTNKSYSNNSKDTLKKLNKLLNRKYTTDQIKNVINHKVEEWTGTDFEKYLTPATLFAETNFDKYLDQASNNKRSWNTHLDGIKLGNHNDNF